MGGLGAWGIGTGIYFVLVQILSLFAGGCIAARLAPARRDQTAISHGLSIWALQPSSWLFFAHLLAMLAAVVEGRVGRVETVD